MHTAKGTRTPMESGSDLSCPNESKANVPYREAIGCLMYLMIGTRVDIGFAVYLLANFVERPTMLRWQVVKRVMR